MQWIQPQGLTTVTHEPLTTAFGVQLNNDVISHLRVFGGSFIKKSQRLTFLFRTHAETLAEISAKCLVNVH